jgi:OOP family OmpA-OmpF porin
MTIEIKGHTDNTGDEIKNQELSEKRAKAVFDYLISKNISASRLSYRGLGGKEPIDTNETDEGRRKNRRVAFVVITN